MNPAPVSYTRKVKRYVGLLVASLLALSFAAAVYIVGTETDLRALDKKEREFHFVTIGLIGKVMDGLLVIPLSLTPSEATAPALPGGNELSESGRAVGDIGTHVEDVLRLQREHGQPGFAQTTARLERHYEAFRDTWQAGAGTPGFPALAKSMERLAVTAEQLERLHMAHYEQEAATLRQKRDAHQRRLLAIGVALLLSGGALLLWVFRMVDRDGLRRAEAEAALKKSEASYAHAQTISHLGHWEWNIGSDQITWSEECSRILVGSPDTRQMTYERFLEILHPDDREAVDAATKLSIAEELPRQIECRVIHPDGVEKVVLSRWEFSVDAQAGGALTMVGTVQDITMQKRTRRALCVLAENGAVERIEDFFEVCVKELTEAHAARYAFIGLINPEDPGRIDTQAVWAAGKMAKNFSYDLTGTPCQDILDRETELIPDKAAELYPEDTMLAEMEVRSYLGSPLVTAAGDTIGLIAVLDVKPMTLSPWTKPIMGSFARRIAAEVERNRGAEALRESRASHAHAQAIAHLGHWEWDIKGGGLIWSDEIYRIFGFNPDDSPTYAAFMEAVHRDDRAKVEEAVAKALKREQPYAIDHRIVLAGGDVRTVHEEGEVTFDEQTGEPVRMTGVVQDITERTREAEALSRFKATLDATQDCVFMFWPDTLKFFYVNQGAVNQFGYSERALMKMTPVDIKPEFDEKSFRTMVQPLIDGTESVLHFETAHRHRDGTDISVEIALQYVAPRGEDARFVAIVRDITVRKKAEEALTRQAQIIDQVHEAVCTTDMDGNLTSWNQGGERQFGYSAEELIGQHVSVLYPEEAKAENDEVVVPNLNKDGVHVNEMLMRKKSGEEFYAHISRTILTDSAGKPYGRLGYIVDISDRKQAEEEIHKLNEGLERRVVERTVELLDEKERAEKYLDIAGNIIVALDQTGNVVRINRKGCEVLGYDQAEIIGKNWFTTCLPKEVRHGVREIFCQTMNGQARLPDRYENDVVTHSGELRTITWNNSLVRGDAGEVIGALSSGEDVTERRKAEAAILQLSRRNALILAAAGDGIYGLDADGLTTFVNPAAADMLGWTQEELIGRPLHDTLHHNRTDGSTYPKSECPVYVSIRDGKVHQVDDEVFWRKDGTRFPVEYTSTPILEGGKVIGAVVTFRDITERQQTEAELLHARKMDSLGSLAGGIAHSLNNLLLPILALTRMTMDEISDRKQPHEQLAKVVQAGERAKDLTARILAFSRHDQPARKYVDINDVIDSSLSLLRATLPATITLETRLDPDAGKVFADAAQIESVLMNLVSNSVDALDGETGRIVVSLTADGDPDKNGNGKNAEDWITLSVTDTGPGVEDTIRERIFDPFFTTKEVGEGTGLGLSVAHGIVSRHGGEMDVDSTPGKGTCVRLRLPRAAAHPNN